MEKRSNLSRLLEYAGKHRYLTVSSWILSAISALLALLPFLYIWMIIREVLWHAPNFSKMHSLAHYGMMAVLFAALSLLIYIAALLCSHLSAFRIASNMRKRLIRHIVTLPMGITDSVGSGKMQKTVNDSTAATETYLAHQLPDKAGAIATPIGLLILLLLFDWRLGLLSLLPVALAFIVMAKMTGTRMRERMTEYQNALDNMSNEAVEYVRGIPVVKTFGQTIFTFKRFKGFIDEFEEWVIDYTKALKAPMLFYTTAINGVFAFLIAGGLFFTRNEVTSEFLLNLIFYIIITPVISITLTKIMFMSHDSMIVSDALLRIDNILNMKSLTESKNVLCPQKSSIEFKGVSFSYGDGKDALRDISLYIEEGETVALVGPSGGGKTTLASLISRFFDVKSGNIFIGGADVRDIPKDKLMDMVAFVFQDSHLLKASIFENVSLGKPNATREEVLKALEAAQCMDIIEKLPQGIDTVIGTKGIYLSGGEQQRISIARVIIKDAKVIILDEATAFADPDNEDKVQAAFAGLKEDKTVIMIAHRLSTVVNADKIFVLDNGELQEQGTHRELLELSGLYAKMCLEYQESAKWKVEKEA